MGLRGVTVCTRSNERSRVNQRCVHEECVCRCNRSRVNERGECERCVCAHKVVL